MEERLDGAAGRRTDGGQHGRDRPHRVWHRCVRSGYVAEKLAKMMPTSQVIIERTTSAAAFARMAVCCLAPNTSIEKPRLRKWTAL